MCEGQPYSRGCTGQQQQKKKVKQESQKERERGQNFELPDVWGMISHIRASFSKYWMGNAAKSVTLWVSRQNGLLKTHCCIRPMYNAKWPSWHSVDSTNYVSLPKAQSQGQGHGSVANGLLAIRWWLGRLEVEGSGVILSASLPTRTIGVKAVFFGPLAHHAQNNASLTAYARAVYTPNFSRRN